MNNEDANQQKPQSESDAALDPEILDRIKHPPAIDDVIRELPPEAIKGNQAVAPEEFDQVGDLRDDLKRDE